VAHGGRRPKVPEETADNPLSVFIYPGAIVMSQTESTRLAHLSRRRFLKISLLAGGADAPENFLAYDGFNNTPDNGKRRKSWGPHVKDWRSRDHLWDLTRCALEFFRNYLPFWEMKNDNAKTSADDDYCFTKDGEVYAVYLKNGGTTDLDLSDAVGTVVAEHDVERLPLAWFAQGVDPRRTASRGAAASWRSGVMSRNRIPGLGKSGMFLIRFAAIVIVSPQSLFRPSRVSGGN